MALAGSHLAQQRPPQATCPFRLVPRPHQSPVPPGLRPVGVAAATAPGVPLPLALAPLLPPTPPKCSSLASHPCPLLPA